MKVPSPQDTQEVEPVVLLKLPDRGAVSLLLGKGLQKSKYLMERYYTFWTITTSGGSICVRVGAHFTTNTESAISVVPNPTHLTVLGTCCVTPRPSRTLSTWRFSWEGGRFSHGSKSYLSNTKKNVFVSFEKCEFLVLRNIFVSFEIWSYLPVVE